MRWSLGCLWVVGLVLLHQAIAKEVQVDDLLPGAAAPSATVTMTLKFNVQEALTISYTCATPDPSGDGSCDIAANAPVGSSVLSFKVNGVPSPYVGTPTFTEATNSFKLSGNSIVTTVSPLTATSYSATITASQ